MHIIRSTEMGTLTLYPVAPHEREMVEYLPTVVKVGEMLKKKGRVRSEPRLVYQLFVGDQIFDLTGSTDDDNDAVWLIRNTYFLTSGGLIYLGKIEVDSTPALVFTSAYCKVCASAMIGLIQCEWKTCDACATACQHQYEYGVLHRGGELSQGQFCGKCGRAKPKEASEKERTVLEEHLAIQIESGDRIRILHTDVGLFADQVLALERAARYRLN